MIKGAYSNHYDVIVVGVGGMGSAACYQLARRGVRVLGLEKFEIGHAMGSSHGLSRILRLAYFQGEPVPAAPEEVDASAWLGSRGKDGDKLWEVALVLERYGLVISLVWPA